MTKQVINNGETGTVVRGKLNSNFTEVYDAIAGFSGVSDGDKTDITVSSSGTVWTIDANAVTMAKLINVATASFLGRVTASTGNVEVLTGTQATTLLDVFTTSVKGLVPAATGGSTTTQYLRKDGSWAVPAGGSSLDSTIIDGSTNAVEGNAIFDALALKATLASPAFTGTVTGKYLTFTTDDYNAYTFVKIKTLSNATTSVGAGIEFGSLYNTVAQIGFDNSGYFLVNGCIVSAALLSATQLSCAQSTSGIYGIGGCINFDGASNAEKTMYCDGTNIVITTHRQAQFIVREDGVLINNGASDIALNFTYNTSNATARTRMTAEGIRVSEVGNGSGTWQVGYSEEYHASGVKLALFGATRIARPTTSHTAATLVSNGGTALTDTDTFDGYTLKQIVKALRDLGALT